MNPYDVEDDWSKIDADAKASREPGVKLMVHCEGCGGFAHFGLHAFDGMESGTILPPCEECGEQMTVLLCKDGEYQRYLGTPSPPPPGWQPLRDAVEAFIVAAENYRIHAVLPIFVPIDIEVKMLQTRNKLRELLALPLPPEAP